MRSAVLLSFVLLGASSASAQSPIFGLDVRLGNFFSSDTGAFVANYNIIAANPDPIFALDFDATATTLWGINNTTFQYGTFDLTTGDFLSLGTINAPATAVTGLTAAADGSTWYLSEYDATTARSFLWKGDVTTGTFTQVGFIVAGIVIDISIDSMGNLYANNISTDSLYRVDTTTGMGTLIGPTGQATNFAQGMDFDWTDDTLYATLYTGGGTGVFARFDLTTGMAIVLEDTFVLNAEMEMAVKVAGSSGPLGISYCFGDGSGTACPCGNPGGPGVGCGNSTGSGALLSVSGTASVAADGLLFTGSNLLPGQPGLLFAGTNAVAGGNGVIFGDGLRCAGGTVTRLGIRVPNAQGEATWGPGLGATGGWTAGDTSHFQGWYRDPAGSPCGFNFNLTQGITVTMTP